MKFSRLSTRRGVASAWILFVCSLTLPVSAWDKATETEERLRNDIKYLASDELEGRGIGSKGLDLAADFIRTEFQKAGLKVDAAIDGNAFQPFEMTTGAKLGNENRLTLKGPEDKVFNLKMGEAFTPLSFGGSGALKGELAFVGYGIEAKEEGYNDYDGIDVNGKTVIIMRREPQQGNPHGKFGGEHGGLSRHSELRLKVSNAFSKGAVGVIFVDDPYSARERLDKVKQEVEKVTKLVADAALEFIDTPNDQAEAVEESRKKLEPLTRRLKAVRRQLEDGETDTLMTFGYGGKDSARSIPLLQITRHACNELLEAAVGTNLAKLEKEIDADLKPQSMVLTGWSVEGEVTIDREITTVKNVIGVLEGEGPLADETLVIGAHYDHVGMGGAGSLAPGSKEVHNGADDNASGTVSLVELARRLASREKKLPRRVVFIAFTAEETGLIGSAEYVKKPLFPLDKTIAMLNMDMVGRLTDDKLTVFGVKTAPRWTDLVEKIGKEEGFSLTLKPEGFGPSDHSSFYAQKIPVLHFFTGTHVDYHRPTDDWDKINVEGMQRIVEMIEKIALDTVERPERPQYVEVKGASQPDRSGNRPYFGSIPDFGTNEPGYALGGVAPGSPAAKGGLEAGDRIIALGKNKVDNLDDFDLSLRKFSAGEIVEVTVVRKGKELKLKVVLDKPR